MAEKLAPGEEAIMLSEFAEDTIQCQACEGTGRVALGEHFVTREMALDACEPGMEGMSMGIEWGPCKACSGDGVIRCPDSRRRNDG